MLPADRRGLMGPVIISDHKAYIFESFRVDVLDAEIGLANGEPVTAAFLPFGAEIVAAHAERVLLANVSHDEVGCVDLATGAERWTAPVSTDSFTSLSASDETTLYLVDADNAIVALDWASGTQLWSHPAETTETIGFVRMADGELLVGRDDELEVIDGVDGSTQWRVTVPNGSADDASLHDGTLFIATDENAIDAVDVSTGALLWLLPTDARMRILSSDANSNLIVVRYGAGSNMRGATAADLMAIDPANGAPIWSMSVAP
jgi:outer membrane protein assembly factor BamB